MDKFELQKLRDLPIEGVAERLGLQVTRHKCLCPFHDDHHASLSFKVSKNTYRCFVCGASGGTIDLVMKCLNIGFKEACRWLLTLPLTPPCMEGRGYSADDGIYPPPSREGSGVGLFDASRFERFFERPWLSPEARRFLYDERRLDPRVVRWCRLTSWKDKQGVPWLQIPYYDREGRLVGLQNRNLGAPLSSPQGGKSQYEHSSSPLGEVRRGHPRFRFPQGAECGIYNLPVLNRLKPGDELYIAEGCSDCWSLLSAGHKAIAIPSATLLSRKDKELLQQLNKPPLPSPEEDKKASPRGGLEGLSFHMFPDRDAPGERLFLQLQEVLPSLVHHQLPPDCKDYSEFYLKHELSRN